MSAALSRAGWIASASDTGGADVPANALDANLGSRWTTGKVMTAGMYFQVDMGASNTISQIVMDSNGSADYARAYSVYVTDDTGTLGAPVATGTASATPITVPCTPKSGRFIRVVLGTVPAGVTSWWSIQEFNAFGTAGDGGGGSGGATGGGGASGGAGAGGGGGASSLFINSGGPFVSPYAADFDFSGGTTINHANTIDLSGVTNPAPAGVYQTARVGNFTYTIGGLSAGSSHTVRLHLCETYFSAVGARKFNVSINGSSVLSAFDVFATAGAKNKALVQQFTVNANATGQYVVQFTSVVDNSLVSGIEIQ